MRGSRSGRPPAPSTIETVEPHRMSVRYVVGRESMLKAPTLDRVLRTDARRALMEGYENLAINGNSADPAIPGLLSKLSDPTATAIVATGLDFVKAYSEAVDGISAGADTDVRLLCGLQTYRLAHGLQFATSGNLVKDALPADRFRASKHIPDPASDNQAAILLPHGLRRNSGGAPAVPYAGLVGSRDDHRQVHAR